MPITKPQSKHLKTLAHNLKPVIMVGQNGVTENVLKELEIALDFHELVKIKIAGENKASCSAVIDELTQASNADVVQKIGKTLVLFRRNTKNPKIELPKK